MESEVARVKEDKHIRALADEVLESDDPAQVDDQAFSEFFVALGREIEAYIAERGREYQLGKDFEAMTERLALRLGVKNNVRLQALIALYLLRPLQFSPAPKAVFTDFLAGVLSSGSAVLDFGVIYGAGLVPRRLGLDPNREDWTGRWSGAILALIKLVAKAVNEARKWLRTNGIAHLLDDSWFAVRLALNLLYPGKFCASQDLMIAATENGLEISGREIERQDLPPGSKLVITPEGDFTLDQAPEPIRHAKLIIGSRDDHGELRIIQPTGETVFTLPPGEAVVLRGGRGWRFWSCGCGFVHCPERHRLASYRPHHSRLADFIQEAVTGSPAEMKPVSFSQGMLYGYLSSRNLDLKISDGRKIHFLHGRLRLVRGLVKKMICADCGREYFRHEPKSCGHDPDRDQEQRREAYLVVLFEDSRYGPEKYFACAGCGKYLVSENEIVEQLSPVNQCPACRAKLFSIRLKKKFTVNTLIKAVVKGRKGVSVCPQCGQAVPPLQLQLCPHCPPLDDSRPAFRERPLSLFRRESNPVAFCSLEELAETWEPGQADQTVRSVDWRQPISRQRPQNLSDDEDPQEGETPS